MSANRSCRTLGLFLIVLSVPLALRPQVPETDRHAIDQIIGAKGLVVADENVYKIGLSREAATIVRITRSYRPHLDQIPGRHSVRPFITEH